MRVRWPTRIGVTLAAAATAAASVQAAQAGSPPPVANPPVLLSTVDREPEAPPSWSNLAESVEHNPPPGDGAVPGFASTAAAAPDPSPATLLLGGVLVGGWALRRLAAPSGDAGPRPRRPR